MTTLAAEFLKVEETFSGTRNETFRSLQLWTHDFIKRRLKAPLVGSDLRIAADQCAERYVFDEEAPDIVRALIRNKSIEEKLVWESTRLPANNTWIEFPCSGPDIKRFGFMIGTTLDSAISVPRYCLAVAIKTASDKVRTCALLSLPESKVTMGTTCASLHWIAGHCAGYNKSNDNLDRSAKQFIFDVFDCLFLINTPRVCEKREGSFGHRKLKMQQRSGLPFVEYKRVVMRIGVGAPSYRQSGNGSGESGESHRRLHRVVGHFRTYREGRDQPKVTFVPQHWRGDANLGILLHEREIKR